MMSTENKEQVEYPGWNKDYLTREFEVTEVIDPGEIELWIDPRQLIFDPEELEELYESDEGYFGSNGYSIHKALGGYLKRVLSLGHLKFFEENPDKIPTECKERGLNVYGWASVSDWQNIHSCSYVPYLDCGSVCDKPYVDWKNISHTWESYEFSGLLVN